MTTRSLIVIPKALAPLTHGNRWCVWKWIKTKGKLTKPPFQGQFPEKHASTTDPSTWCDLPTAMKVYCDGGADGIGFVLSDSDVGAFDIDDCRDATTQQIHPWAIKQIKLAGSYAEITPSRQGVGIIGLAHGKPMHCKFKVPGGDGVSCELYRKANRFITITGKQIGNVDALAELDDRLDTVQHELAQGINGAACPLPTGGSRAKLPPIDFDSLPDIDFSTLQVSEKIKAGIDSDGSDLGNGDRSRGAARVACALARAGLSDQEIVSILWHEPIGAHCHDQPDPERAICRVIAFARKGDAANEFDLDQAEDSQRDKWADDPADLWEKRTTEQPAALPPDTVPNLVWRFAADRGRRLGVEPGAPAAALITALGSLVPAEATIQPRQRDTKWAVRPILWTMLIGAPGTNKSAVLTQAMAPIQELEREWRAEFQEAKRRHQAAREFPSTKPKTQGASAVFENTPTTAEPRCRRKIANDATTEALAGLLAENSGGLLYFAEELAGLFGSMDVYRQRSGKDRAFWLQAKDGGPITVDRKTQSSIYTSNCAISVLGSIQPDKLSAIAANLTNDGLLQRFTPVFIDRKSDGEDIDPNEALDQTILQVARSIAASSAGRYRLSPEADAELRAILRFKNDGIDRGDADPIACQWLEKLPNEFARTALVFHFIEWFSNEAARLLGDDPPAVISAETARRASHYLTKFVYNHAQTLYQTMSNDAVDEHAQWIGGLILSRRLEKIDERTVYRARTALQSREKRSAIFGALRVLELFDWARPTAFRPNGQAKCWSVNPAVHDGRFADRAASERQRRADFREKMKRKGETQ